MVVRFTNICGIVNHYCLSVIFFFIDLGVIQDDVTTALLMLDALAVLCCSSNTR